MKKRKSMGNPSGFRDLLSGDSNLKEWLVKTITEVYQKYGFRPIETPLVEFTQTLANEVTDFNLYSVVPSKERQSGVSESLSLRFDQTVPLARFIVDHMGDIVLPFKRYVYGPVFRGETAQMDKGRYRQFDQFDIDIVGSSNISSDMEILLCMHDVMRTIVGENKFIIRANTRKLLNCLPQLFEFPETSLRAVLIELDKRDKVNVEALVASLVNIGLSENSAKRLVEFGSISGKPNDALIQIRVFCNEVKEAEEALSDLQIIADTLSVNNAPEVIFDMSIIRGLGYYTGMVFETNLTDALQFGSVYSGGRYDGLVESFGVQSLPAVGASIGVDRMITALQFLNFQIPGQGNRVIVLVQDPIARPYSFQVANIIRKQGIICEIYTGAKQKLGDQFMYADKLGYEFVVIVGANELTNGTVNIKDQKSRTQITVNLNSISVSHFKN